MKRLCMILFILLACTLTFGADQQSDVSLALGRIKAGDALFGLAPTYLEAGVSFSNLELFDGLSSEVRVLAGGARSSYILFTDENGDPLANLPENNDDQLFAFWEGGIDLSVHQELIADSGLEAYLGLNALLAFPVENIGGEKSYILASDTPSAYPDKEGTLTQTFRAGVEGRWVETGRMMSGARFDLSVSLAPRFLLNEVIGTTDFYQLHANGEFFLPLWEYESGNRGLLSVYLADRVEVDYLKGAAVPQLNQLYPSLGRKMRGFGNTSLGVNFTAVNNFEIRFSGPQLTIASRALLYPRFHLFLDTGYAEGAYWNTSTTLPGTVTVSAGAEAALNLLHFLDVGYRFGTVVSGDPISGETLFQGLFVFLHW